MGSSKKQNNDELKIMRIVKAAKCFFDRYEKIEEGLIKWAPWKTLEELLPDNCKERGFLRDECRELEDSLEAARLSLLRSNLGMKASEIIHDIRNLAREITYEDTLTAFENNLFGREDIPEDLELYDTRYLSRLRRMENAAILDAHIKDLINGSDILQEPLRKQQEQAGQAAQTQVPKPWDEKKQKFAQNHKDFLRNIAMEIFALVATTDNRSYHHKQVEAFSRKVEEHQQELDKIKKDYDANCELREAVEKLDEQIKNAPVDEDIGISAIEMDLHFARGWGMLENFKEYIYYEGGFWGLPAQIVDLVYYLQHSGALDPRDHKIMPTEIEKLLCSYTLLSAIHDKQVKEKPIFFDADFECGDKWPAKVSQRIECFNSIHTGYFDVVTDIQAWIERVINDVKADLGAKRDKIAVGKGGQKKGFYDEEIGKAKTPLELREVLYKELAAWHDVDLGGLHILSGTLGSAVATALAIRAKNINLNLPEVPSDIAGLINWCITSEKIMGGAGSEGGGDEFEGAEGIKQAGAGTISGGSREAVLASIHKAVSSVKKLALPDGDLENLSEQEMAYADAAVIEYLTGRYGEQDDAIGNWPRGWHECPEAFNLWKEKIREVRANEVLLGLKEVENVARQAEQAAKDDEAEIRKRGKSVSEKGYPVKLWNTWKGRYIGVTPRLFRETNSYDFCSIIEDGKYVAPDQPDMVGIVQMLPNGSFTVPWPRLTAKQAQLAEKRSGSDSIDQVFSLRARWCVLFPCSTKYREAITEVLKKNDEDNYILNKQLEQWNSCLEKYGLPLFEENDLRGINLGGFELSGQEYSGINLDNVDLSFSEISVAQLIGAKCYKTDFTGTLGVLTNLSYAICQNADFSHSHFSQAQFHGADLTNATLADSGFYKAEFDGAILNGATLYNSNFKEVSIDTLDISIEGRRKRRKTELQNIKYNEKTKLAGISIENADWTKNPEFLNVIKAQNEIFKKARTEEEKIGEGGNEDIATDAKIPADVIQINSGHFSRGKTFTLLTKIIHDARREGVPCPKDRTARSLKERLKKADTDFKYKGYTVLANSIKWKDGLVWTTIPFGKVIITPKSKK